MSRKDIFYSGSVTNLKEYQSQKSLTDYRNSVISLTKFEKEHQDRNVPRYQDVESSSEQCMCLPPAFRNALSSMLDVSLLKVRCKIFFLSTILLKLFDIVRTPLSCSSEFQISSVWQRSTSHSFI